MQVLFVCTGNICRSPMGERLLRARLNGAADHLTAASAGTRAVAGYPMDRASAAVLAELGGDPDGHVARQLTPAMINAAAVVLTATTEHRSEVLQLAPAAMRRTFTLKEFARLSRSIPEPSQRATGDLAARIAGIAGRRGLVDAPAPGADDIADPLGARPDLVRACGEQINDAVRAVARVLTLRTRPLPPPVLPGD